MKIALGCSEAPNPGLRKFTEKCTEKGTEKRTDKDTEKVYRKMYWKMYWKKGLKKVLQKVTEKCIEKITEMVLQKKRSYHIAEFEKILPYTFQAGYVDALLTEKPFRYLIKSNRNQLLFSIFRLIWNQTDVHLILNQ